MPAIPAFLLKKLYQAKSLRNEGDGFEFSMRNTIAPATIIGVSGLQVDGVDYPVDTLSFVQEGAAVSAAGVSADTPVAFGMNQLVTVHARGAQLSEGTHPIALGVKTREVGDIKIEVSDTLS